MRWVYILKGNRYYVGSTNDKDRRIQEHRDWKTYTTLRIGERELVKWISCKDEKEARSLERKIKKWWHYERWIQ